MSYPPHSPTRAYAFLILIALAAGAAIGASSALYLYTKSFAPEAHSLGCGCQPTNLTPVQIEPVAGEQGNLSVVYKRAVDSVVEVDVEVPGGGGVLGSGFVVEYAGREYAVTNYHVVENATQIAVRYENGNSSAARLVGYDRFSDLAVLLPVHLPEGIRPLPIANSSDLFVGETVVAIGSPFGLSGTLTVGVVSALDRVLSDPVASPFSIGGVIQITTPINPGNSGGPLLTLAGQVVGVTTAIIQNSENVGFAIPSLTVAKELPWLVTTGSYQLHPYFGFSGVSMNYFIAAAMGAGVTRGVLVQSVIPGSPAAKAGLVAGDREETIFGETVVLGGDIIVAANGVVVTSTDQLVSYLQLYVAAGQNVVFTVYAQGKQFNITVTAGRLPYSQV